MLLSKLFIPQSGRRWTDIKLEKYESIKIRDMSMHTHTSKFPIFLFPSSKNPLHHPPLLFAQGCSVSTKHSYTNSYFVVIIPVRSIFLKVVLSAEFLPVNGKARHLISFHYLTSDGGCVVSPTVIFGFYLFSGRDCGIKHNLDVTAAAPLSAYGERGITGGFSRA